MRRHFSKHADRAKFFRRGHDRTFPRQRDARLHKLMPSLHCGCKFTLAHAALHAACQTSEAHREIIKDSQNLNTSNDQKMREPLPRSPNSPDKFPGLFFCVLCALLLRICVSPSFLVFSGVLLCSNSALPQYSLHTRPCRLGSGANSLECAQQRVLFLRFFPFGSDRAPSLNIVSGFRVFQREQTESSLAIIGGPATHFLARDFSSRNGHALRQRRIVIVDGTLSLAISMNRRALRRNPRCLGNSIS